MALGDMDGRQLGDLVIASPTDNSVAGTPSAVVNLVLGRAPCPTDINCDASIDALDTAAFMAVFAIGVCPPDGACRADLTGDGLIDGLDFAVLAPAVAAGGICP